jgi:hypothetical protein
MMEIGMSQKSFVEFYETYLPGTKGADAVSKLKAAKDEKEYSTLAVQAGKAAGYDFTADEVVAVMKTSEAKKKQASGELSEDQLEAAVGGATSPASQLTVNLGGSLNIQGLAATSPKIPNLDLGSYSTVMCPW